MENRRWEQNRKPGFTLHFRPGGGGGPAGHLKGPEDRAKKTGSTILRLWGYIKVHSRLLLFAVFTMIVSTGLLITGPYLQGVAIDNYLLPVVHFPGLGRIVVLLAIIYLVNSLFVFLQHRIMVTISQQVIRKLRQDLFTHFQELPLNFFDTHPHGELMSLMSNDIENISNALSVSILQLFSGLLTLTGVAVMMFILSWQLGLVCLTILPLVIFITRLIASHTRRGYKDYLMQLGNLNGLMEETITGQCVVKAFCREQTVLSEFSEGNKKLRKKAVRAIIFAGFMGPMMNMINNLNFAITAFAGGLFAVLGKVSVGTIAIFLHYTRQFSRPLNHIAQLYNSVQSALAGAERVFEIMDMQSEFKQKKTPTAPVLCKGKVEFKDVYFSYKAGIQVLKGINIKVDAGKTIALVGPTGAGKTTIVNLLTRFYPVDSGSIQIDGIDLENIGKKELRRNLGIVLQDTFLFSATVMENIRYGKIDAPDKEVYQAAEMAYADFFIRHMPEGYQTMITENGSNLSQGQRQLLAISRAILSDPAILILDEATSSVDTRTEVHIRKAMLNLMHDRTSFVIAHRLNTIREADCIIVINNGRIVEQGTHSRLMAAGGFYHNLFTRQFQGEQINGFSGYQML